jgi:hypothetical protein
MRRIDNGVSEQVWVKAVWRPRSVATIVEPEVSGQICRLNEQIRRQDVDHVLSAVVLSGLLPSCFMFSSACHSHHWITT